MSGWALTDEVKERFTPIIQEFIDKIETMDYVDEESGLNLSDTELNGYTLWKLLEDLGYEQTELDHNGWQMDFWIRFEKEGFKTLSVDGTGITFELALNVRD